MHNITNNKVLTYTIFFVNYCFSKTQKEIGEQQVYNSHRSICLHLNFVITRSSIFTTCSLNGEATSNITLLSILHRWILNAYGTLIFSPIFDTGKWLHFLRSNIVFLRLIIHVVVFLFNTWYFNTMMHVFFWILISLIVQNNHGINKSLLITLMSMYHKCYSHQVRSPHWKLIFK